MQIYNYLKLIAVLLGLLSTALNISNSVPQENAAKLVPIQVLAAAMAASQSKLSEFLKDNRLAYTREKVDRDGEIESYRYTPTDASKGIWFKVDTDYSTNRHDEKVWESDIFFAPESFQLEHANLADETDSAWFFDLPISLDLTVDSDKVEPNEKHKNTFRAVIELVKKTGLVTSFKVYSIKEFNPQLGVTIDSFQSLNELKEIFKGGPLVVSEQHESIRGDVGFFISLDEDTKIKNFDFSVLQIEK